MVESKEQQLSTGRVETNEKWKLYDFVDQIIKSRISSGEKLVKENEVVDISKIVSRLENKYGPKVLDLIGLLLKESSDSIKDIKSVLEHVFDDIGEKGYIDKLYQNINGENHGKVKDFLFKKYENLLTEFSKIDHKVILDSSISKDKEEISKDKEEISKDKEEISKDKEEISKDKEEISKDKEEISKDKEEISKDKEEISKDKEILIKVGNSLKESANRFYEKYKGEFEAKNYDKRVEQMNKSLTAHGVDEQKLGMSIGEYATLIVTMQVMGELNDEGKLSNTDKEDYIKFVGDYDKFANLFGEKSNLSNYTKDNSIYYENISIKNYISSEPKTKLNLNDVDETLIKQFGIGENALDQGNQLISNIFKLNGNKQVFNNYMDMLSDKFSRINGNNKNSDKIGDVSIDPKGKTPEFNMSYNIDGFDLKMQIDEKGTVYMTDLLNLSKDGVSIGQTTIDDILPPNELVKIPTLADYEDALREINFQSILNDIKYQLKSPNTQLDIEHNEQLLLNAFNHQLSIEFAKKNRTSNGETYEDEQLNNVITDQQTAGFFVNLFPDKTKVNQYKQGQQLSQTQDTNIFEYLQLMGKTLNYQSTDEKIATVELFKNIKSLLNDPTIHNNPNYNLLTTLFPQDGNGDTNLFDKVINSFTDYKGGEKILDLTKLEKFYQSCLKNNSRELKATKNNEEDENPDAILNELYI